MSKQRGNVVRGEHNEEKHGEEKMLIENAVRKYMGDGECSEGQHPDEVHGDGEGSEEVHNSGECG